MPDVSDTQTPVQPTDGQSTETGTTLPSDNSPLVPLRSGTTGNGEVSSGSEQTSSGDTVPTDAASSENTNTTSDGNATTELPGQQSTGGSIGDGEGSEPTSNTLVTTSAANTTDTPSSTAGISESASTPTEQTKNETRTATQNPHIVRARKNAAKRTITTNQNVSPKRNPFWRRLKPAHYGIGAVVIALVVAVSTHAPVKPAPATYPAPTTIATPSATLTSPVILGAKCHAQYVNKSDPQAVLPDTNCTPGETNSAVTQATIGQTICVPGYTKTIRPTASYTDHLKVESINDYGYTDTNTRDYEEDHLISLELGGNPTSPLNLWAEPGASINEKDKVENYLHQQVCSGALSLQEAQREIVTNWYQVFLSLPH